VVGCLVERSRAGHEGVTLSQVSIVLRPRWLVVLGTSVCAALIAATPGLLRSDDWSGSVSYAVLVGTIVAVSIGQRSVTVMDEGLWIRRSYADRFFCQWSGVVAVERRQLGPFAVDQLVLREPVRKFFGGKLAGPPDVTWRPTSSKRILIGVYDRQWRIGPIGAALTAHGVSLVATARTDLATI
jgi:hypothetical protein